MFTLFQWPKTPGRDKKTCKSYGVLWGLLKFTTVRDFLSRTKFVITEKLSQKSVDKEKEMYEMIFINKS